MPAVQSGPVVGPSLPEVRWWHIGLSAAWLALLIGETLALSLSFDTNIPVFADHPSVLVRLMARSSVLLRVAISLATVATMVLLGSAGLRRDLVALLDHDRYRARYWIVVHLAAYGTFFWLTKRLIEDLGQSTHPVFSAVLWMACGAGTLVSWGLAAKPPAFWLGVLRRAWKVLVAGAVIGIFRRGDRGHNGSALGDISPLDLRRRQDRSGLARSRCDLPSREFRAGDQGLLGLDCPGLLGIRGDRTDLGLPGRVPGAFSPGSAIPSGPVADSDRHRDHLAVQRAADRRAGAGGGLG